MKNQKIVEFNITKNWLDSCERELILGEDKNVWGHIAWWLLYNKNKYPKFMNFLKKNLKKITIDLEDNDKR